MTWAELFYKHKADLYNMEDYIEEWHTSDSQLKLHEYLGLTTDEYSLFLKDYDKFKIQMLYNRSGVDQAIAYYPSEEDAPMRKIPCGCRKSMAELAYTTIQFDGHEIMNTPIWHCDKCDRTYFIEKQVRQAIRTKMERLNKKREQSN